MKEITKQLARSAKAAGICNEWFDRLRSLEDHQTDEMLDLYIKGIDFCMANDWPSLEYARKTFKGKTEHRGIHIDEPGMKIENVRFNVLLGASGAVVNVDQYNVSEIYVRHESTAEIVVSDHAFVVVDLYDKAKVKIQASGNAKIIIKNHGDASVEVEKTGSAAVKLNQKYI